MSDFYYFETVFSTINFGKHKGEPLFNILQEDSSYIYWCINNIPEFTISEETLRQIRGLLPSFIITENFESHIGEPYRESKYYNEQEHDGYYYERDDDQPTYERYNGSYAQDEMGYSDDDIDTIFDGDPLAYWNID